MEAFGEPFFTQPNPALFATQGHGVNDTVTGHILWAPTSAQVRPQPYIVVIRISDGFMTQDLSLVISVSASVGNDEVQSETVNVYPNPAVEYVQLTDNAHFVHLMNIHGTYFALKKESRGWDLRGIPAGTYFLHAFNAGGDLLASEKIVVLP